MKRHIFVLTLIAFAYNLSGQQNATNEHFQINNQDSFSELFNSSTIDNDIKGSIISEIEFLGTKVTLSETIMDSSVTFQYFSEYDSIKQRKVNYEWYDNGLEKSSISQIWDIENNQWNNLSKSDYAYDINNNRTSYIYYIWSSTYNNWEYKTKREYLYNINGSMISSIGFKWYSGYERWNNDYKNEWIFDENENLLLYTSWEDDTNNEWEFTKKEESTFNSDNTINTHIISTWDNDTESWLFINKEDYIYYSSGLLEVKQNSIWSTDMWNLNQKWEYVYTDNDNIEQCISSMYSSYQNEWIRSNKHEYEYDENDNEISDSYFNWFGNPWTPVSRNEKVYDNNNNTTLELLAVWDTDSTRWNYLVKRENAFNQSSDYTLYSEYHWNDLLEIWEGFFKWDFIYKNGELFYEIEYLWDDIYLTWTINRKFFKYYTSINDFSDFEIDYLYIYPNPACDVINIKMPGTENVICSIMSLSGQKLLHFFINETDTQIYIGNLPKGVYLLQINIGSQIIVKKLIKQ